SWCAEAAERLALEVCAHADLREALVSAANDGCALSAQVCALRARCRRLRADRAVLACALDRAVDTAHRLSTCCAAHEASSVSLCLALRAADRALEAYDVLLALAETDQRHAQRASAELVARQLLARLDAEQVATIGEPLLSPGPWLQHDTQAGGAEGAEGARWSAESENAAARARGAAEGGHGGAARHAAAAASLHVPRRVRGAAAGADGRVQYGRHGGRRRHAGGAVLAGGAGADSRAARRRTGVSARAAPARAALARARRRDRAVSAPDTTDMYGNVVSDIHTVWACTPKIKKMRVCTYVARKKLYLMISYVYANVRH
ncbi:uncharacterized protein LOC119193521, partial [Manduca sexta]|uniref:uncharacterized protein LOC119193521 n=1 Tax=Manduca sexta TaxID=7130 RepID=UPI00188E7C03